MKIQYMSDLHMEFRKNRELLKKEIVVEPTGDILLVAGDCMYLNDIILPKLRFWKWAEENYRQVLIVPGNHEYYQNYNITSHGDSWQREIAPNISYYYNKVVRIDDTDFILSTLWSRISEIDEKVIWHGMNDFHCIMYDDERLRPKEYNQEHVKCFRFIREAVAASDAKHIVVVTHHAPSLQTIAPEHQVSSLRTAFATDLDAFIEDSRIDYWVYGHSHTNIDCQVGRTKIVSNQLGYVEYGENRHGFEFDKYFEL